MYQYLSKNQYKNQNKKKNYISILTLEQLKECYTYLNLPKNIINYYENSNNIYEIHNNYNLGIISLKYINEEIYRFGLYISKKLILIIILNNKKDIPNISNTNHLIEYLNNIIEDNIYMHYFNLETLENKITYIEKEILNNNITININKTLFSLKRHINNLKKYNDNIIFFIENIKNINIDILTNNTYNYIKNIESKLNRLNHKYEYLIENILQLHDIYTLNVDYTQNKIIKSLTIISSIFLPLSLITSWYGMNFKYIPELNYKYSYFILILIVTIIILIIIFLLKKKKII